MYSALLHPGDLGLTNLLIVLLTIVGILALVIFVFAGTIYKSVSAKKESFTVLNLENNLEPINEGGEPAKRT